MKLTDLLDEGIRRSEMKLLEKERDKVIFPNFALDEYISFINLL